MKLCMMKFYWIWLKGSEHIKIYKTETGLECTIFVRKDLEIVEMRQSHLEKLEEQLGTTKENFDILEEIDTEIR